MRRASSIVIVLMAACSSPAKPPVVEARGEDESAAAGDDVDDSAAGEDNTVEDRTPTDDPAPTEDRAAGLATDAAAMLAAHNAVRATWCAAPLAWSDALATEAAAWARSLAERDCAFEHSRTPHGENLAAGTEGALGPDEAVAMWADEARAYDFRHPGFGMDTGHFTQVAWRDTTAVGCGSARCNGLTIWVCNYDPAGNVEGEFPANVRKPPCR